MPTIIDSYVRQHRELTEFLGNSNEISLKSNADTGFTKVLILASASYFEDRIVQSIYGYSSSITNGNELILSFIKTKGLERQYHTLFDWNKNNANKFFSHFGEELKTQHTHDIKNLNELQQWEQDFMFLGRTRNVLVHSNFASAPFVETYEEIYEKFNNAIKFIEYIESIFAISI